VVLPGAIFHLYLSCLRRSILVIGLIIVVTILKLASLHRCRTHRGCLFHGDCGTSRVFVGPCGATRKNFGRGYINTIYIVRYTDVKEYCGLGEISGGGVITPTLIAPLVGPLTSGQDRTDSRFTNLAR